MIFSTTLYFSRSRIINSAQLFDGEYTDLGFEITDNHVLVGFNDLSDEGYTQQEIFSYILHVKYREKTTKKLNIFLDLEELNLDDYPDSLLKVTLYKDDQILKDNEVVNIENNKIYLYDEKLEYTQDNHQYKITLNLFNKNDESDIKYSYDIASKLSADLI